VQELLRTRFGLRLGFADPGVTTLDPAMGTGAYLIHVIDHAAKTAATLGVGLVDSAINDIAHRLIGFEVMTGPYAVAEVLVGDTLRRHDADEGLRLHLTDTLADPWIEEGRIMGVYEPIARSRREANEIKKHVQILVCLGNPPYDRHRSSERTGGWVRWGNEARGQLPIFDDFRSAHREVNLYAVNLYNLYVYFWRWALWKVFEAHPDQPKGVVSFITAASFTDGPGFAEMRAHMRRVADEIWIIDLSPEGHQPDVPTRVFPGVQVPVCITIVVRYGEPQPDTPAQVHTITLSGLRQQKFERLQRVSLDDSDWKPCGRGGRDPFTVESSAAWQAHPPLLDLLPWHSPGVKTERSWVIGPQREILVERWRQLVAAPIEDRGRLLKSNRNRTIHSTPRPLPGYGDPSRPMAPLSRADADTPPPSVVRYGYRAFDRQWILADHRLMYPARPDLWSVIGPTQLFLVTQHARELRSGPALVASEYIPDMHHFQGSFGGAVLPLWRDASGQVPNVPPGLLRHLSATFNSEVTPEKFAAYLAAVLAHPGYTRRFERELQIPGPRVPLTASPELFERSVQAGTRVLWLHTYGARAADPAAGRPPESVPAGRARVTVAVPSAPNPMPRRFSYDEATHTLYVGEGAFTPVDPAVARYEVGGMRVVSKWLNYRLAEPSGRRDSPLDEVNVREWPYQWTLELLELLWVLEALVELEREQAELLDQILEGPLVSNEELHSLEILPAPASARGPVPKEAQMIPGINS
jgi:Type ISP C-terminal specificity domain